MGTVDASVQKMISEVETVHIARMGRIGRCYFLQCVHLEGVLIKDVSSGIHSEHFD